MMVEICEEICIGCGACAADCLGQVIRMKDGKASVSGSCIQCGHCVAICPVSAVSISEYEMDEVEEYVPETFDVAPENMLHMIKFRRSIRNFQPKMIEKEKAERVLDAGRYTATAKNAQECTFIFVQDTLEEFKELVWAKVPEVVEQMRTDLPQYAQKFEMLYERRMRDKAADRLFFNTPAFLLVASNNLLDGGLASANIENMAVAEGLGALYSGYLMRIINACPELKEWLGIGEKKIASCMLLGYPAVSYRRTAPRRKGDIVWK